MVVNDSVRGHRLLQSDGFRLIYGAKHFDVISEVLADAKHEKEFNAYSFRSLKHVC